MKHTPDTRRDYRRILDLCERYGEPDGAGRVIRFRDTDGIPYRIGAHPSLAYGCVATIGIEAMRGTWFPYTLTEAHALNYCPVTPLLDAVEARYLTDGAALARSAHDLIPAEALR